VLKGEIRQKFCRISPFHSPGGTDTGKGKLHAYAGQEGESLYQKVE